MMREGRDADPDVVDSAGGYLPDAPELGPEWTGGLPLRTLFGLSLLGWSLYGLLSTAQSFIYLAARSQARPLAQVAGLTFVMMWFWALLTPLIVLLSLRFPLRRGHLSRSVPVHATLILALPLLDVAARQVVYPIFGFDLAPVLAAYLRFFDVSFFAYVSIAGLTHAFDSGRRLHEDALARSLLEGDLTRAELVALKMQIQPHFLFNTLHGLAETVREDPARADQMITRLGALLRTTMDSSGAQEVSLRQELKLLEAYLSIQQLRFEEGLDVEFAVSTDALDARVPNFLLQPLVENALYHGLDDGRVEGRIVVRAYRRRGALRVEVHNSGQAPPPHYAEGLGIRNTRARLRRLYGSRGRFTLESRPGTDGTTALVELPFVEDENVSKE